MTEELRFETLLTFYFSHGGQYKQAAIRRAYRDFNRTLTLGTEKQSVRNENRLRIESLLNEKLSHLLKYRCINQDDFDKYHRKISKEIGLEWEMLTVGHIQKWINMTLKYWLIIGEKRISGIELNSNFFHIPVDSIVLEKIFGDKNPNTPWSKIKDYDNYFKYQLTFRERHPNKVPIIFETEIFNK